MKGPFDPQRGMTHRLRAADIEGRMRAELVRTGSTGFPGRKPPKNPGLRIREFCTEEPAIPSPTVSQRTPGPVWNSLDLREL